MPRKVRSNKKKGNNEKYYPAFDACVDLLDKVAKYLDDKLPYGMDYKKLNVVVFCIIGPIVFLFSITLNVIFTIKLLT